MVDNYRGRKSFADQGRRRHDNFGRGGEHGLAIKRFAPRAYGERQVHNYATTTGSFLEKLRLFVATGPRLALILLETKRRDVARDATHGAYPVNEIAFAGATLASQAQ